MLTIVRTITAAGLLAPIAAMAARPDDDDEFCEVIAEAPNVSVPPKDRLWFEKNCICLTSWRVCGKLGSKRFEARLEPARKADEASAALERASAEKKRKEVAAAKAAVGREAEQLRQIRDACLAFQACMKTKDPSCSREWGVFQQVCSAAPQGIWSPCSNKNGPCELIVNSLKALPESRGVGQRALVMRISRYRFPAAAISGQVARRPQPGGTDAAG
jgi:hypothetical protein